MKPVAAILLSVVALGLVQCGNGDPEEKIVILALSEIPDPKRTPYPNIASLCLARTDGGEKILVAIPVVRDRIRIANPKRGDKIRAKLIPWHERPDEARAMFVADDIHEPDLKLFYASPVSSP